VDTRRADHSGSSTSPTRHPHRRGLRRVRPALRRRTLDDDGRVWAAAWDKACRCFAPTAPSSASSCSPNPRPTSPSAAPDATTCSSAPAPRSGRCAWPSPAPATPGRSVDGDTGPTKPGGRPTGTPAAVAG
jgi:hypothetical protein